MLWSAESNLRAVIFNGQGSVNYYYDDDGDEVMKVGRWRLADGDVRVEVKTNREGITLKPLVDFVN